MPERFAIFPSRLEGVRRRFEDWRRTSPDLARQFQVGCGHRQRWWPAAWGSPAPPTRCGSTMRRLKEHIKPARADASTLPQEEARTTFVELPHSARVGSLQCIMELEDVGGAKMRVRLRSAELPTWPPFAGAFGILRHDPAHAADADRGGHRASRFSPRDRRSGPLVQGRAQARSVQRLGVCLPAIGRPRQ